MLKESILFDQETIDKRVKELAEEIYDVYKGEELVFVCTLKGAVFFCCDLMKNYRGEASMEFIKISSYVGENSTGKITMNLSLNKENIKDKNVLIVEDIVDTGYSLEYLYNYINEMKPKTLSSCALLDKQTKREVEIKPTYSGFVIDDLFVIGYGLDYNQKYRNLPYIKVLKK